MLFSCFRHAIMPPEQYASTQPHCRKCARPARPFDVPATSHKCVRRCRRTFYAYSARQRISKTRQDGIPPRTPRHAARSYARVSAVQPRCVHGTTACTHLPSCLCRDAPPPRLSSMPSHAWRLRRTAQSAAEWRRRFTAPALCRENDKNGGSNAYAEACDGGTMSLRPLRRPDASPRRFSRSPSSSRRIARLPALCLLPRCDSYSSVA